MKRFFCNRIFAVALMCACAMTLCTQSLYAIEDGDIVTIKQITNSTDYYLYAYASMYGGYRIGSSTDLNLKCLWIINIQDNGQLSFSNLALIADKANEIYLNVSTTYGTLQMAQNASAFTLDGENSIMLIEFSPSRVNAEAF